MVVPLSNQPSPARWRITDRTQSLASHTPLSAQQETGPPEAPGHTVDDGPGRPWREPGSLAFGLGTEWLTRAGARTCPPSGPRGPTSPGLAASLPGAPAPCSLSEGRLARLSGPFADDPRLRSLSGALKAPPSIPAATGLSRSSVHVISYMTSLPLERGFYQSKTIPALSPVVSTAGPPAGWQYSQHFVVLPP